MKNNGHHATEKENGGPTVLLTDPGDENPARRTASPAPAGGRVRQASNAAYDAVADAHCVDSGLRLANATTVDDAVRAVRMPSGRPLGGHTGRSGFWTRRRTCSSSLRRAAASTTSSAARPPMPASGRGRVCRAGHGKHAT